jgi:hypothetical protein
MSSPIHHSRAGLGIDQFANYVVVVRKTIVSFPSKCKGHLDMTVVMYSIHHQDVIPWELVRTWRT